VQSSTNAWHIPLAKDIASHNPFARFKAKGKVQAHRARPRDKRERGNARQRGYSSRWDKFRAAFLAANPVCIYCLNSTGRVTPATVVDHIIPHKGDPDLFWPDGDPQDHFAPCCKACHDGPKAKAESVAERQGRDVRTIMKQWGLLPENFTGGGSDF